VSGGGKASASSLIGVALAFLSMFSVAGLVKQLTSDSLDSPSKQQIVGATGDCDATSASSTDAETGIGAPWMEPASEREPPNP